VQRQDFLRHSIQEKFKFLEIPWPPIKTHFFIFYRQGRNFYKNEKKWPKISFLDLFFDRRCAPGVTLGDLMFEGLPVGHFKKFKVLWELELYS